MAIFKGTWKDDEGVPFDDSGKVLHTTAGGGVVCVKRTPVRSHRTHAQFTATIRRQRDHWWSALDDADRTAWETPPTDQASRRGDVTLNHQNRFVTFNAKSFVDQWHDGLTEVIYPSPGTFPPTDASGFAVDTINQTVTFNLAYPNTFLWQEDPAVAVYQADPRYVRGSGPYTHTRLLALQHDWTPAGGTWSPVLPLAWPLATSDTAAFYLRARSGFAWTWQHLELMVPPL